MTGGRLVVKCLDTTRKAYEREGVLGSPEKDVINSQRFKVVGAEINCSEEVRSRDLATVSAPTAKRLSMSVLSLKAAVLPVVSRGLMSRLIGSWTSIIMYRRCLSSTMSMVFQYGVQGGKPEDELSLESWFCSRFSPLWRLLMSVCPTAGGYLQQTHL